MKLLISTLFSIGMLLALIMAILWPLAFIWALNTLFLMSIQYTFLFCLACWVLILTFQGAINVRNKKTMTF